MKLLSIIFLVLICSCVFEQNKNLTIPPDTLLTRQISFPKSLNPINNQAAYSLDSFLHVVNNKPKIVSIIDGNCSACIINFLNGFDLLVGSLLPDDSNVELVFILNVSPSDSSYFMRNMHPEINTRGKILWDNNFNFERENKLFTPDQSLRTFMVDKDNRIIIYGNPLMEPKLLATYKEKIEQCH